jgi:hypothetical protein
MDKINELKRILGENLVWNKARLDCFVRMLLALFVVRTSVRDKKIMSAPREEIPSSKSQLLAQIKPQYFAPH